MFEFISISEPELSMLVGPPASGKSTLTEEYERKGYMILSSDRIRASLIGTQDELPKDSDELNKLNIKVFEQIRKEAILALRSGISVVIDATNLSRKKRMAFLKNLGKIKCRKKCILFVTPREICLERNSKRTGIARVPDAAMKNMFCSFECPGYWEGWDEILPIVSESTYQFPFEETVDFSQDNPHHSLTLYGHLNAAKIYAEEHNFPPYIQQIAYYHDIGKLYAKEFKNRRGEDTEFAHFYGHENYGAYLYLCEMCCGKNLDDEAFKRILYLTNLINCHMRPLNAWKESAVAKERDIALFGEEFVRDIELINEADRAAH